MPVCSVVSNSLRPYGLYGPYGAYQVPLSTGFFQARVWSGLPFPSPEDLPTQGLNLSLCFGRQVLYP